MESALTMAPPICSASASAACDLPLAVGPAISTASACNRALMRLSISLHRLKRNHGRASLRPQRDRTRRHRALCGALRRRRRADRRDGAADGLRIGLDAVAVALIGVSERVAWLAQGHAF